MFSDENMLLNVRLNVLNQFVDKFIISESAYLHDGSKKKLNFNINDFINFKDKIEYIVVKDQPPQLSEISLNDTDSQKAEKKIHNSLKRENYQREQLSKGVTNLDSNDLIIVSDVDEIPDLTNIDFKNLNDEILIFKQKMFYYKFNLYYKNFVWFGTKATKKKNFVSPQWLRNIKNKFYPYWRLDVLFSKSKYNNIRFVENGGWHFTCVKKPKDVQKKLLTFLHHQDFEDAKISLSDLENKMREKEILYDHKLDKKNQNKWITKTKLVKIEIENLPLYLQNNQKEFSEWFEQ
tara:strand:+ start:2607 stop:3482 length:876 start_codon:yes stop_codon:yes gene_type:complete